MNTETAWPPSLWAETAVAATSYPPLRGETASDVVVIGAGFSGLSSALHLARRGIRSILIEGKAIGWGASGRNNGQVIPTLSAIEPAAIVKRHGETGERLVHLIGGSADLLFRLAREENIDCEAEQSGWYQPAHSPDRLKLSERRVRAWQSFGFPAELIDKEASARLTGSDFWYGGMYNPTGGHINPLSLARGLGESCRREGVEIFENSIVVGIERTGGRWRVSTRHGSVVAQAVVLATNAYTDVLFPRLAPSISRSIVPIISWQVATRPLDADLRASVMPGRQAISDTRADLHFFRYDSQHRIVTGGAVPGPWRVRQRIRELAIRKITSAFPQMGEVNFTHMWNGQLGMTMDRFPHFHQLGPDFWSWTGCNGRGVALAISIGREFAALVSGAPRNEIALPLTEPDTIHFQPVSRHVAPLVYAWHKRRDKKPLKLS